MCLAFVMKAKVITASASQFGVVLFCETKDEQNTTVYANVASMLKSMLLQGLTKEAKLFALNRKQFDIDFALASLPEFEVNIFEGDDGKFRLDFHREDDEEQQDEQQ